VCVCVCVCIGVNRTSEAETANGFPYKVRAKFGGNIVWDEYRIIYVNKV